MLKLPIKCPQVPYLTQAYGNKSSVPWYIANGLNLTEHNGADFITGDSVATYGTPLVCPFETAKVVKVTFDTPMSTKGNGVTIEGRVGDDKIQVVLWHTGEVALRRGDKIKEGDIICYIGNSGLCRPAPTAEYPYNGSHLHLMIFKNGILGDPATIFDFKTWYLGDYGNHVHDIHPIIWATEKLGISDWWMKLILAMKWWQ